MGQVRATVIDPGTIVNSDIQASAGIEASKCDQQDSITCDFHLESTDTPVAKTLAVYVAQGPGTLQNFKALLVDNGTSVDVDFDLLVNGASVLSAVVNITHVPADGTPVSGTISSASLVAGDIVTCDLAVTSSTGALGPVAYFHVDRDYV